MENDKNRTNFNTVLLGAVNFLLLIVIGMSAWIGNKAYERHESDQKAQAAQHELDVKEQRDQHDAMISLTSSVRNIESNMAHKSDVDLQIADVRSRQASTDVRVTAIELEMKSYKEKKP